MTFKIVQTEEDDQLVLSILPERWEAENVLNWPLKQTLAMERLLRDGNSIPPLTGCYQMECKVKRRNIGSHKEACSILASMKANSDSDVFSDAPFPERSTKKSRTINYEVQNEDFNCDMIALNNLNRCPSQVVNMQETNYVYETATPESFQLEEEVTAQPETNLCHSILCQEMGHKIMDAVNRSLARMEAKIEALINLKTLPPSTISTTLKPCESAAELTALDERLSDISEMQNFQLQLTNIAGRNMTDGTTICYNLIDNIVARKVLLDFSWSGSGKDRPKLKFENLKNLRNAIIEVVRSNNDGSFSNAACETFFINILKNAVPRSNKDPTKQSRRGSKRVKKAKASSTDTEVPVVNDKFFE